jgi:predicted ArsR family transcriptional regulator
MWRYAEDSAKFIFAGREVNPFTNKILDLLREREMSTTDIYNAFDRHISKGQLEQALTELVSQKKVTAEKEKGGGRPKSVFRILNSLNSHNSLSQNEK